MSQVERFRTRFIWCHPFWYSSCLFNARIFLAEMSCSVLVSESDELIDVKLFFLKLETSLLVTAKALLIAELLFSLLIRFCCASILELSRFAKFLVLLGLFFSFKNLYIVDFLSTEFLSNIIFLGDF